MPLPQRKPKLKLAQTPQQLPNLKAFVSSIASQYHQLKPTVFTLSSLDNPHSLPLTCSELLFDEKLLNQSGKINRQHIYKLKDTKYLNSLKAKLIYGLIKSQYHQQLSILSNLIKNTTELHPDLNQYHLSFTNLFADYHSYTPANIYLANRHPHLLSPRLKLTRLSNQQSTQLAQTALINELKKIKPQFQTTLSQFFNPAVSTNKKIKPNTAAKFTQEFYQALENLALDTQDLTINLNHQSFPSIKINYHFPLD